MSLKDIPKRINDGIDAFTAGYMAFVLALTQMVKGGLYNASPGLEKFAKSTGRGQVDTIITVVIVAVVAIVGILIYSQVDSSISIENNNLSNASDNLTSGFGDAMELVPIVLIVLVAALVIGVISRFRR